ncbi:unnamed protein product, partial [marine sediment metagenome]
SPGVRVVVKPSPATALPYLIPADHPGNLAARDVLTEIYGRPPCEARMGGTIPVCALFLRSLGAHTVVFAFGLDDERVHAPNEFFRLSSFELGQRAYCRILERLGHTGET